ncbi:MAG: hypothetical protein JEZ14_15645 [Marinilabiliaceae bacterium]|nr:hypothetical protein [Marinilabiliaceae bacterium]
MKTKIISLLIPLGLFFFLDVAPSYGTPYAKGKTKGCSKTESGLWAIICPANTDPLIVFAARDLQRYIYLLTGELIPLEEKASGKNHVINLSIDSGLKEQAYRLKSDKTPKEIKLTISGGSLIAVYYGICDLVEQLGVRFQIEGDVIPDEKIKLSIPDLDFTREPLFKNRGLNPYHDFSEGPDWWEVDDYKVYLMQMAKMRMNAIVLHTYPPKGVFSWDYGPEPQFWLGLPDEVNEDGTVKQSYPSRMASTDATPWGYNKVKTSDFAVGAGLLFSEEEFSSSIVKGHLPWPKTPEDCNEVFNRAGAFYNDAFSFGRRFGMVFAGGTEVPTVLPPKLKARVEARGMDPESPETMEKIFEGTFRRIQKTHPLDYYMFWTSEKWTGAGASKEEFDGTIRDLKAAERVLNKMGNPFKMATSGWVLGPQWDRGALDKELPKDAVMATLSRAMGWTPLEPTLAGLNCSKWVLPWAEDDDALTQPQLWVGRTRRDAADALKYGGDGFFLCHWRTKGISPQLAAAAEACWSQEQWNPELEKRTTQVEQKEFKVGGRQHINREKAIAGTDTPKIYQSHGYGDTRYVLQVPNGTYTVTLKFCENFFDESGKRVMGVKINGRQMIRDLDVYDRVGMNKAYDISFGDIEANEEKIEIELVRQIDNPFLSGIEIDGMTRVFNQIKSRPFSRRINCGAGAIAGFEAEPRASDEEGNGFEGPRGLPVVDFYVSWCKDMFGPEAGPELAALFSKLDGGPFDPDPKPGKRETNLPRPTTWNEGPGAIKVNFMSWQEEKKKYAFVDEMAALRSKVKGQGNLSRFDYWLGTFVYLSHLGHIGCLRGALDKALDKAQQVSNKAEKQKLAEELVLPVRKELAREWENLITSLLAITDTPGEMGTLSNLEQHVRRNYWAGRRPGPAFWFLAQHDDAIEKMLGYELPADVHPSKEYSGDARIIVPAARTQADEGEELTLKVIILDQERPEKAALYYRLLGQKKYKKIPLKHVGRAVYKVTLPAAQKESVEYHIKATIGNGKTLYWPATAPQMNHTIVTMPIK